MDQHIPFIAFMRIVCLNFIKIKTNWVFKNSRRQQTAENEFNIEQ